MRRLGRGVSRGRKEVQRTARYRSGYHDGDAFRGGRCCDDGDRTTYEELTACERYVVEEKGTEPPFTGEYDDSYGAGTYACRRCDAPLYQFGVMPVASG